MPQPLTEYEQCACAMVSAEELSLYESYTFRVRPPLGNAFNIPPSAQITQTIAVTVTHEMFRQYVVEGVIRRRTGEEIRQSASRLDHNALVGTVTNNPERVFRGDWTATQDDQLLQALGIQQQVVQATPTLTNSQESTMHDAYIKQFRRSPITKDSFVKPKLEANPTTGELLIVPRQHWKTGMLVHIRKRQSSYGSVSKVDSFYGVLLAKEGDTIEVLPLAGTMAYPARIIANGLKERLTDDRADTAPGYSTWLISSVYSARSATLLDPANVHDEWYQFANAFRLVAKQRGHVPRPNVRARLAGIAQQALKNFRYRNSSDGYLINQHRVTCKINGADVASVYKILEAGSKGDASKLRDIVDVDGNTIIALGAWNKRHPTAQASSLRCNHIAISGVTATHALHGFDNPSICSHCYENRDIVISLHRMGYDRPVEAMRGHCDSYSWSDGTYHDTHEQALVGSYHSSKQHIRKLPTLDGKEFRGLTIGFELELENINHIEQHDKHARYLKQRLDAAVPDAWKKLPAIPKYGFFERDGSVSCGFEMVTAYGDINVHRHFISRAFGPDTPDGKMPLVGKMHSHDAVSSCGIHVHMAKPNTLSHAARLQAFYNDASNRRLVKTVARRYGGAYAKADPGKGMANVSQLQVNAVRNAGFDLRYAKMYRQDKGYQARQYVSEGIKKLGGQRYSQVNYQPDNTVEVRTFKGSTNPITILACIEFAQASWFYSRDTEAMKLTTENFLAYISSQTMRSETKYLRAYLAARGFKVFQAKAAPGAATIVHDFASEDA